MGIYHILLTDAGLSVKTKSDMIQKKNDNLGKQPNFSVMEIRRY